jgi:hypothetical protein
MRREVLPGSLAERVCSAIVFEQASGSGGERARVVIRHREASVLERERACRTFHRHDRQLPSEGIEHLDREPTFGASRDPGHVACGVSEPARSLPVEPADIEGVGDTHALGELDGGGGVRLGGQEQSRSSVLLAEQGQRFEQMFPALVPIEVARVETEPGLRGQAQRCTRFESGRGKLGR